MKLQNRAAFVIVSLAVLTAAGASRATADGLDLGACCAQGSCLEDWTASDCAQIGGVWQGPATNCVGFTCPAVPDCPPGAREFFNENNCGSHPPTLFQSCCVPQITPPVCWLGNSLPPLCVESSAMNGFRDRDLWAVSPLEDQQWTICVTAPFHAQVQLWEIDEPSFIEVCMIPDLEIVADMIGVPGSQTCVTVCVRGGLEYGLYATVVDAAGAPMLEGVGCTQYIIETTATECPLGACCIPPNGDCQEVNELDCADLGGFWFGDGTTCLDVACEPNISFCDPNCDGLRSVADIGFFVVALTQGEAAWQAQFPNGAPSCVFESNDINDDGFVTVADISGFVACLIDG